jgi:hypothetical protein
MSVDGGPPAIGLDELLELETSVWQALVDGDAAADVAALGPDFLGVYPTGFAGRDDHAAQLAGGPTVAHFALADARILVIAADAALLAYRAEYVRAGAPAGDEPEAMFVSSLWCRRGERWVNVFSQDSPDTGEELV